MKSIIVDDDVDTEVEVEEQQMTQRNSRRFFPTPELYVLVPKKNRWPLALDERAPAKIGFRRGGGRCVSEVLDLEVGQELELKGVVVGVETIELSQSGRCAHVILRGLGFTCCGEIKRTRRVVFKPGHGKRR
jgi:hypothetical protein